MNVKIFKKRFTVRIYFEVHTRNIFNGNLHTFISENYVIDNTILDSRERSGLNMWPSTLNRYIFNFKIFPGFLVYK